VTRLASSARVAVLLAVTTLPLAAQATTPGPFEGLRFRSIGPATMSGRIDDFAVFEANPSVFYVATATGGVWKTVNNGTTFEPVFDREGSSSVGDVAIAPSDPNVIWVGTGENNNRQSSSWGDGLYKSTDGGATWKNVGLRSSKHIARIVVDPVDQDVVYVAALGDLWAGGGERGVFKTTDGGLTWTPVLEGGADVGATELVMDPANNKVLYAALYQRRRASWGFHGGGPGSAIYKTSDAGRTWTKLEQGLPAGDKGRIGMDVYRKQPNVVYARIEHASESGVYRSDDAGRSWTKLSSANPRPMYFSQIRIDPNDDSRIYVLGVQLFVSDDGGRTFRNTGARNIHVDFHAMWVDPANSSHLMIGGDGGVGISYDRSATYVYLNNLPVGQFYHVAHDRRRPYTVCGGLQDNNTWCGPSAVRSRDGIGNDEWFVIGGGDGFVALVDPTDATVMYAESQNGRMNRVDRTTNERKTIRPEPPADSARDRWNWDTPMTLSPHDPATIFVGANRMYRSTDRGHSWVAVSPDLTTATNRDTLMLMGVKNSDVRLARNDGVSAFGTLSTLAESPSRAGIYWAGSDDGLVHVSRDAGGTWTNVTAKIPNVPKLSYVSTVAPSRFAEGAAYVTFDNHRIGDYGTYVFQTTDFGAGWRPIKGDLPAGEVARALAEDLVNPDVLYLGTETGLFVTTDRGRSWTRVRANLPTVPIYEITLHPDENAMLLATHGRSIWILDDLTPFQRFAEAQAATAHLFQPQQAVEWSAAGDRSRGFEGDRRFLGENPEAGAVLTYSLNAAAKDVRITIRDDAGEAVRVLDGEATKEAGKAGINRVVWDLRLSPLPAPDEEGGFFAAAASRGPLVLPGDYTVDLTVDGSEAGSRTLTVQGDPEIAISDGDRRVLFETLQELHELHRTATAAVNSLNRARDLLAEIQPSMRGADAPDLTARVDSLQTSTATLRRRVAGGGGFGGPPNLRGAVTQLKAQLMGSTSLPTEAQIRQLAEVRTALPGAVDEVNALVARFPPLLEELARRGVHPAPPTEVKR